MSNESRLKRNLLGTKFLLTELRKFMLRTQLHREKGVSVIFGD